jgi:uncharacterized membrane protein
MNSKKILDQYPIKNILVIVLISTLVLFFFSSLRHSLFQSGVWDLGFFDQGVYLISQGFVPISSFTNFHVLGDHAAFILYPLSIFYKIYPDVHWLFLVQAIALSLGAIPVLGLSCQQGLTNTQRYIAILSYLLSPLIFNANLFDFHPDVIAVPFLLWAILWSRLGRVLPFCFALLIILSCKSVFALTVIAMGIWLALFERQKLMGAVAIVGGILWFVIAAQIVIPMIGGEGASTIRHIGRYASLGSSYSEIFINFFLKPNLIIGKIFSMDSLVYFLLLFLPFIWCLASKKTSILTPLIGALPTFAMSILSDDPAQRYLANQYPLPILPFLMIIAISSLGLINHQKLWYFRFIAFWTVLAFVTMSRLNLFTGEYLASLDTWQANNDAIALVNTQGNILTTYEISPHVTHRLKIKNTFTNDSQNLEKFDYILLNTRHSGFGSSRDYSLSLVNQAKRMPNYKLVYQKDDVYLFVKDAL